MAECSDATPLGQVGFVDPMSQSLATMMLTCRMAICPFAKWNSDIQPPATAILTYLESLSVPVLTFSTWAKDSRHSQDTTPNT